MGAMPGFPETPLITGSLSLTALTVLISSKCRAITSQIGSPPKFLAASLTGAQPAT